MIWLTVLIAILPLAWSLDPLQTYLHDDCDKSYANYTLLSEFNNQTFNLYTLNVTSLRWFNCKYYNIKTLI